MLGQDQHIRRPAENGLRGYEAAIANAYGQMEMDSKALESECTWTVDRRSLGPITFSHVACDATLRARVKADAMSCAERKIVLMCVEKGVVEHREGERHAQCGGHSLFLMNMGRQMEAWQSGAVDVYSVTLPTHVLMAQCADIERLCGVAVPAERGLALILHDMVKSIARESEAIEPAEARAVSAIIGNLVGGIFQGKDLFSRDAALVNSYQARIEAIIDEHVQDPELSPRMIAEQMGISKSYLFSMARKAGLSIGKSILDRRLEYCREVLADRSWEKRSITDIAFTWGFKELSHFSRCFSGHFGCSPKAYRERALQRQD